MMISNEIIPSRLVVIDQAFDRAMDCGIRHWVSSTEFADVPVSDEKSIWARNAPLNPVFGRTIVLAKERIHAAALSSTKNVEVYPTGGPADILLETVIRLMDKHGLISSSQFGEACGGIVASLFRYGPNARLSWHSDDPYLAAFSIYVSENWNADWGGYFAFADENDSELGIGRIVAPKFSRCVLIGPGVTHAILPLAADASAPRIAFSGFFVTSEFASQAIAKLI